MGLGKTNEIIWLAETLKRRGLIEHCFIICGVASLRQNWKNEINKFSTESCCILGEKISRTGKIRYASVGDRANQLINPIEEFFVITNVESIRSPELVKAFQKSKNKFGMIAVDEAHMISNKSSHQGANLLKLEAEYKVAATGTLITNSPISCYVPLSFTENDQATLTNFKAQYCVYGGFNNSQVMGYQNLDLLKDELDGCSLRRTLDQVRKDMPAKTVNTILVEMDDDDRKFYDDIKNGVKEEADKIELNANNVLALATRLRQATACPTYLTSKDIQSTKLERCKEMTDELVSQGEKVIIMASFKESVYKLASMLKDYAPFVVTGDQDDAVLADSIKKFQEDPSCKVFICTHKRIGTGWTLNAASYMICVDTPYTYSSFSQSCDRMWRYTNTRPAFITTLVCKDTFDERVAGLLESKKELGDYLVDGKVSETLANELRNILRSL